jgi:hypothetical protein
VTALSVHALPLWARINEKLCVPPRPSIEKQGHSVFEGLLFNDVQALDAILKGHHNHSLLTRLQRIRAQFKTPEEINDGETTAPSKRLQGLYPGYDKILFGPLIAQRIGLDRLRQECLHFHDWMSKLEALVQA